MNTLQWETQNQGILFRVMNQQGQPVPLAEWGLHPVRSSQGNASVGPLLALQGDEIAQPKDQGLWVAYQDLATLDAIQAKQLGLPPVAPYHLDLRGEGTLSSPGFRFIWQLLGENGRPAMGLRRDGVLLGVGKREYLLLDPLYSLIQGVETFNAIPPTDMDTRFLRWAELKELLPEDAVVDDHLRSMNIARADTFTLDLREDDDFDPLLIARSHQEDVQIPLGPPSQGGPNRHPNSEPDQRSGVPVLPEARQADFAQRFRRLGSARARYALPASWYVVVPERLQKALAVVHDLQQAPAEQKRAFVANPHGLLKERLQGDYDESLIEDLFQETPEFLSARIACLGEWQPKSCAYIKRPEHDWLPDEDVVLGVPVNNAVYDVSVQDLPQLLQRLRDAQQRGEESVEYHGQHIPATQDSIDAFAQRVVAAPTETIEGEGEDRVAPPALVPIIVDNLEEGAYQAGERQPRGEPGGLPAVLQSNLYPHQTQGLDWLQHHWAAGSPGALLADDMGLGKTLQTLAFLAWVNEQMHAGHHPRGPHLVVAPTGLLTNWEHEAHLHLAAPRLGHLFKAYGRDLAVFSKFSAEQRRNRLRQADWVMTTYETLRDKIGYFIDLSWGVLVFDEVQKIKNPTSRLTEMAKSVKADMVLTMTGTPVENSLADLWCIVDTAHPGLLGSLKGFHNDYVQAADQDPLAVAPLKAKLEQQTQPPTLLRRMKQDHLEGLPDKREHIIQTTMPAGQASAYSDIVGQARQAENGRNGILKALQGFRQVSLVADELGPEGITDEIVQHSARLSATVDLLDAIHDKGEKALIFLEFLHLQEALVPYLQERYQLPHPPVRISGKVQGSKRKAKVDEFQNREAGQFDVMLLSPKAGGVGITLTAANHVIHLSRWWNPAVEDQCTDRALRIGQTKEVQVYYPLAVHPKFGDRSFDLNLHHLLEHKRELSRSVLAPAGSSSGELGELLRGSV